MVCVNPKARGTCRVRVTTTLSRAATIVVTVRRTNGRLVGQVTRRGRAGKDTFLLPRRIGRAILTNRTYRFILFARDGVTTSVKTRRAATLR